MPKKLSCAALVKLEEKLVLKHKGFGPNGKTRVARPKSLHKSLMRINKVRRQIRACRVR